jgi:adenosylcobinamide kinase / adenosylcobinamide-phosphate guanylyltransferase
MGSIVLITGGGRSGKSSFALRTAAALPGPRLFIATCPVTDDEMRERVRRHQAERRTLAFDTVEQETDLAGAVARAERQPTVLVDCLTLWINNLMYEEEKGGPEITETSIAERCRELLAASRSHAGTVLFVTNEVGMGIIPDNALARRFRDLAGRCNATLAADADQVWLCVCGIPIRLKG